MLNLSLTMKKLFYFLSMFAIATWMMTSCQGTNTPEDPEDGVARYSILVYGNAGGHMDFIMEGLWERLKPQMKSKQVRISFLYKYGKAPEEGQKQKYAAPGTLMDFELTSTTNLDSLRYTSATTGWEDFAMYDPECLKISIDEMKKNMPAHNYILLIWGHGAGFDPNADYPKDLRNGGPKKAREGVLYDEWLPTDTLGNAEALTMFELREAIAQSQVPHFKAIYFHNCLLGNMETLDEIYDKADYLFSSMHLLASDGWMVETLVQALYANTDFEKAGKAALTTMENHWKELYSAQGVAMNGDFNFIKSSEFAVLDPVFTRLSKRLVELYPTQSEAIDRAMDKAYKPAVRTNFYDALDYANKLAAETNDAELKAIATDMKAAFEKIFLKRLGVFNKEDARVPEYTLSVYVIDKEMYNKQVGTYSYTTKQAYEYSRFHQQTLWGNWLNTNTYMSTVSPCGQVIE